MPFRGLVTMTDQILEKALDGVSLRQRVTANNIANVETPGYKRYSVSFEETLKQSVQRSSGRGSLSGFVTHPGHMVIGSSGDVLPKNFVPTKVTDTTMRNDGNNVDIELESAQIIKDQIHYTALAQEVTRRYAMVRDAITGGR